jgi:hypothetical protein
MWTLYREDVSRECECEEPDCPFHWLRWKMAQHEQAPLLFRSRSEAEQFLRDIVPAGQWGEWVPRAVEQREIHLLARLWGNGSYYLKTQRTEYVLVRSSN